MLHGPKRMGPNARTGRIRRRYTLATLALLGVLTVCTLATLALLGVLTVFSIINASFSAVSFASLEKAIINQMWFKLL